jgi:hypothetical protein
MLLLPMQNKYLHQRHQHLQRMLFQFHLLRQRRHRHRKNRY